MSRSQETYNKKEVRKKKDKKRKMKAEKRAKKRLEDKKSNFDDMIAYVDEFGKITSEPPDQDKKSRVKPENIQLGAKKSSPGNEKEVNNQTP